MMTNLEQQLENLYIQKNKIEEEILKEGKKHYTCFISLQLFPEFTFLAGMFRVIHRCI